jgi:hypothetical protein
MTAAVKDRREWLREVIMEADRVTAVSDDEVAGQVRAMLAVRHLPSLERIIVEVSDSVIRLGGSVMTYFERNVCEECCRQIPGIVAIHNEIHVLHVGDLGGAAGPTGAVLKMSKEVSAAKACKPGAAVLT